MLRDPLAYWCGYAMMLVATTAAVVWAFIWTIDKFVKSMKAYDAVLHYFRYQKEFHHWLAKSKGVFVYSNPNRPLEVNIEEHELVIRIGVDTLAFAAGHSEDFYNELKHGMNVDFPYINITDKAEWARDVRLELLHETETGETPVHRLLDRAFMSAFDNGSLAVEELPDLEEEECD